MKRSRELTAKVAFVIACLCTLILVSKPSLANNSWLNPQYRPGLQLELTRPDFAERYSGLEYSGLAAFLTANIRVSQNTNLVLELPWSRFSMEYQGNVPGALHLDRTDSKFGNLYFGATWARKGSSMILEMGIRLPTMDDKSSLAGGLAQATVIDRLEAFYPKATSGHVLVGYRYETPDNVMIRILGGINAFHPKNRDTEMFFDYRAELIFSSGDLFATGTFAGRYLLTAEGDADERATGQFMLAAGPKIGRLTAGIHLIFSIDDDVNRLTDSIYGLNFGYSFSD